MFSEKGAKNMRAIFWSRIKMLIHRPWNFIITTAATFAFALFFSLILGGTSSSMLNVPIVAGDEGMENSSIGKQLTTSENHNFYWVTEEELKDQINKGNVEQGVFLYEDRFEIFEGVISANTLLIEQLVKNIYIKELQFDKLEELIASTSPDNVDKKVAEIKNASLFTIEERSFKQEGDVPIDYRYQALFGMTLFFIIYTIAYRVLNILVEKQAGLWDRMILSPVSKTEMYAGNLLYSFFEGYIQVVIIFSIFHFIVGVDFHGKFLLSLLLIIPYVFTIVALSLFITGLVKNVQQFNAAIPIVAVSMAMIGGAYWPLEIVQSDTLLFLSNFMPIKYSIELLNGIVVFNLPLRELLVPTSILLAMGVVLMVLGIRFMERRHV